MKNAIKLFDFMGTPVYLKYWFFILLLLGINTFVSLFIAVIVHELAHAFVAKKLKHPVDNIFLSLLYGGASIETEYMEYKDVILIGFAGPLSNFILYGIGTLLLTYLDTSFMTVFLLKFCYINLILGIFNLIPIFPLDGGRISRAICQWVSKPTIGRKISSVISIIFCLFLVIVCVLSKNIIMAIFSLLLIYVNYKEFIRKY